MQVSALRTPQVLIDRTRLSANIDRMQALAAAAGIRLRPHAKTHKSPVIARWQIERGAVGVCCAKLGEAEVFAAAGIDDIRLPYPIHPSNADRVIDLMHAARVSIIVDDADVAAGWSEAMTRAGRTLDVLVKIDVGFHRCGIDPAGADAAAFVARVGRLPGLRLRGVLSHAGHAYGARTEAELCAIAETEARLMAEIADAARGAGAEVEEISVGATPTARFTVRQRGITEMRPGNYVFFDRTQVGLGSASLDDCALTVLATVVSKPAQDRIILDCGSKTLSSDGARGHGERTAGFGAILDPSQQTLDESLLIERLSEEHATVRVTRGRTPLRPGDRVRVLPNHACVVCNLVDVVQIVEGEDVVETLPVAARGRIA
jgi:D-serine deaminase-like pyridoxal phosphate-dependent protein